jgi:hypothetical protein
MDCADAEESTTVKLHATVAAKMNAFMMCPYHPVPMETGM